MGKITDDKMQDKSLKKRCFLNIIILDYNYHNMNEYSVLL